MVQNLFTCSSGSVLNELSPSFLLQLTMSTCLRRQSKYYLLLKSSTLCFFNPLTPGAFCKKNPAFLDILAVFRLYFGQISFNLVENAFATRESMG